MNYREVELESEYVARLETGAEWRSEIESLAADVEADAAWFTALGAVQDAEVWFYDQDDCEYHPVEFDEPLEVASCVGNVAWLEVSESHSEDSETESRQWERFAHTHVVLSRPDGEAVAGHLNEATVWAGEVHMRVFEEGLERAHDETTDLDLWL
ncbi:PPC domain-containing DNA-binding protein [Natrialbaceae archaeon AArc-T1-2]|uniref:PPC domain-containing DNA-binding protein n=1 Tax=Natrialbaceae archaeon AArc-T1-2 TaxID=3053904 RepID=UPI00255B0093|nr:PPC domain-containing DNA-binding protein [Natrialbaceae archaeon AArc-T1-2]WIV65669.1 DNA-binding protein [Natrialbaceae archaeon AArc-T1-2]